MVALAFVVVGASSLVTPVTAAKPAGAGDPKSDCAQGPGVCGGARGPDPVLPPTAP